MNLLERPDKGHSNEEGQYEKIEEEKAILQAGFEPTNS